MENLTISKELLKGINKSYAFYDLQEDKINDFIEDAKRYIQAVDEGRIVCTIKNVSKSGMSRTLYFAECTKMDNTGYPLNREYVYLNFNGLFLALGYKESRNYDGFVVSGCGMDMIFYTNYCIIHDFHRVGLIDKATCEKLAQARISVI